MIPIANAVRSTGELPSFTMSPPMIVRRTIDRKLSVIAIPMRNSVSGFAKRFSSISDFAVTAVLLIAITPARNIVSTIGQPRARPRRIPVNMLTPRFTIASIAAGALAFFNLLTENSRPTKNIRRMRPR